MLFSFIWALKNSPTKSLSIYQKSFEVRNFILEMADVRTGSVLAFFWQVVKKCRFFHFLEKTVRVIQKNVSFGPTRKQIVLIIFANER